MTRRQQKKLQWRRSAATLTGILLAIVIGGVSRGDELGALVKDGAIIDTFQESSRGPILRSSSADSADSTVVTGGMGAPQVSMESRARNAAMRDAALGAVAIRDYLQSSARNPERLQELVNEYSAAQAQVRYHMDAIEARIEALRLPRVALDRHRNSRAGIDAQSGELMRLLQAALAGDTDAADEALALLNSSLHGTEPKLLNASPNYSMEIRQAPRVDRAVAGDAMPLPSAIDPPGPDDLAETEDIQFTPEIVAKAAELNNSPQEIYEFVRNTAGFQPYLGTRKGAAETLRQLRGNDTDQASLLLALLRTSGIPSRYVRGTVELTAAAAANWLGVDDAAEAGAILTTAGLDGVAIVNGPDVVAVRLTKVWVEAYLPYSNYRGAGSDQAGKVWVPLDPSLAGNNITPGLDTLAALNFDENAFLASYISTFTEPTPLQTYQADVQTYLDTNDPGNTVSDVARRVEIAPQALGLLPASLPFTVLSISDRLAELEDSKRYKVRLHMHAGATNFIDRTFYLTDLVGRRFTVEWVGTTQTDQDIIEGFGGIYETPPDLVSVKPLMKLDSVVIETGVNGIGMGFNYEFDMEFFEPQGAGNSQPFVNNQEIAGNGLSIGFDTFLDVRDTFFDDPNLPPGEQLDAILYSVAVDYLDRVDRTYEALGNLMGVVTTQDVSEAVVSNAISVAFSFGVPITFEWTGLIVDADRRVVGPFPVDGDAGRTLPFTFVSGLDGSYSENKVFEDIFDQNAVSTVKILELSSDEGIPICTITFNVFAECPTFSHGATVLSAVSSAIAGGNTVTIPANPITVSMWSGTGYIDREPSGAGGYIIAGGISSGMQVPAGGATVDSWPIFLPCEAVDVQGVMLFPPADTPHPSAVFCPNDSTITFTLELTTTCEDDSVQVQTLNLTTHKTTKQFGPGDYDLVLQAFGTQILRSIKIGEVKIASIMPNPLQLGEDATIGYEVDFPNGLSSANLEIMNKNDAKVFETGVDASGGSHMAMWPDGKWNQAPHSGAFANPNNGAYQARIRGMLNGETCDSEPMPLNTKLVLETVVEDKLPGAAMGVQVAGLEDMKDALKVTMKNGGDETEIPSGSVTVTDESGGSKTMIKKRLMVEDPALNTLDDGTWEVLLKDLRDEIGNFTDGDGAAGIQPPKAGQVELQ